MESADRLAALLEEQRVYIERIIKILNKQYAGKKDDKSDCSAS